MIRRMLHRSTLAALAVALCGLVASPSAGATTLFTLTGHGWGHGIGMSQYGALGFAQRGYNWKQIIKHYYTGVTIDSLPGGTQMRVLLLSGKRSISVSFASAATGRDEGGKVKRRLPAGIYRLEPGTTAGNLRLWSAATGRFVWQGIEGSFMLSAGSAPLRLDERAINGYTNDHWAGDFRIVRHGTALDLINHVGMERYVRGVVPCEVPATWEKAAVRAQAVAARTYAVATRKSGEFDAYPDTRSQVYCPIEQQAAASDDAVTATKRQVVKHNGSIATTFFSSSSGGRTSSIQASWGSTDQQYLVPVPDPYDSANGLNPNHDWSPKLYTPEALTAQLGVSGLIKRMDHNIDSPSKRVLSLVLHRAEGPTQLSAGTVFSRLGLRSTFFRILQTSLVAPAEAVAGSTFTLQGRLLPKPTGAFRLEQRVGKGGDWTEVKTPTLDEDGFFAIPRRSNKNIAYRLIRKHAFSPVEKIGVYPNLTLEAPPGGGFRGTMVRPVLAGSEVLLVRNLGSGWEIRDSAVVGPAGGYSFSVPVTTGTWKAHFAGDDDHSKGNSPYLEVTAPARPLPPE
ncbi:MAG: stage sporulation protein [Gaiellales bacterium]|nr:stage sporulation protein [Gaiellales bacterium]